MPRVSVIMPVYNEDERFLRAAISSILDQSFTDFEFIIINDGSTNNVEEVVLSYKDARIVYVKNEENLKVIKSLNKGLSLAKGEYIARMDADDMAAPQKLEIQVAYLDNNPTTAAVGTFAKGIPGNIRYELPTGKDNLRFFMRYCANCIIHPTILMRKSVLDAQNLQYKEEYPHAEDYKLWCDLMDTHELENIPEQLFFHRLHTNSVSAKNAKLQSLISDKILFECLEKDFKPNKLVKKAFKNYLDEKPISSLELLAVDALLYKVTNLINTKILEPAKPVVKDRYTTLYKRFLMSSKHDILSLIGIYFGKMNKYIGFSLLQKLELHIQQIESQSKLRKKV